MPRLARLDAPLVLHHVWDRGIERRSIFADDEDRSEFLGRLAALVRAEHFAVYAWALMSNHFHLLLRTGNRGLSSSMQVLLGGYAAAFNCRHERCGHLFQNRFKSTVVDEDGYCLELVRYIHLNPLRAGVVADLERLGHYRWTGHATLLGHLETSWQDSCRAPAPFDIDAAEFVEAVVSQLARKTGLRIAELTANTKRRCVVQVRQAICYLALRHAGLPARTRLS